MGKRQKVRTERARPLQIQYRHFLSTRIFDVERILHTPRKTRSRNAVYPGITGNIVTLETPKEIRSSCINGLFLRDNPRELRNLILSNPTLSLSSSGGCYGRPTRISPTTRNVHSSFYFPTFSAEVTGKEIIKHENRIAVRRPICVGRKRGIPHNVRFLPDMFEITHGRTPYDGEDFNIEVYPTPQLLQIF